MTKRNIITAISCVEMLIGASTVTGLLASAAMAAQKKPANVFLFVLVSAAASFIIGAGLFRRKEWARMPLVFFSGYIMLTKMLVFAGLMKFSGEIITFIPADLKNLISILYHFFVVIYFTRMHIKKEFT